MTHNRSNLVDSNHVFLNVSLINCESGIKVESASMNRNVYVRFSSSSVLILIQEVLRFKTAAVKVTNTRTNTTKAAG